MQDIYQTRQLTLQVTIVIAALVLIFRCFQLQVVDPTYRAKPEAVTVYPARGLVYDRNGKQLVNNEPTYDLMATYNLIKNIDTTKFCKLLGITKEEYVKNLSKDFSDYRFSKTSQFPFYRNISADVYSRFAESLYQFPGFEGVIRSIRGYDTNVGAHVLGYISEVTQRQIDESKDKYVRGEYVGASGLELAYEEQLRGEKGVRKILKDNLGRVRGAYRDGHDNIPAQSGLYLISSLDIDLQKYGEELMQNKRGAIVAIEPKTGEILSLVSAPTYDPNLLTVTRDRGQAFAALSQNDSLKPLLNRAIQSRYPPGSTFKPIMALIGLQEQVIHNDTYLPCHGGYMYVGCHGHEAITNPAVAIKVSCNGYFSQVLRLLVDKFGYNNPEKGLNNLVDRLHAFGLGVRLGIDLPNELPGNIPTSDYYNRIYKKGGWFSPTIMSIGIGQGEIETTPLQMANATAIIANRGFYYIPHLVKEFRSSDEVADLEWAKKISSETLSRFREVHQTGIDTSHFSIVVKGMEDVVLGGTAASSRIRNIQMCGKTGTVQNRGVNHSTFIAFAPRDNPQIAICVYVENSGYGATYAAPIASLMVEKYINGKIADERKAVEERIKNANLLGRRNSYVKAATVQD